MSLIQDALKRQHEETESSRVQLKSAVPPPVPATMPVSPNPEPADRSLPADRPLRAAEPSIKSEKPMRSGKSWKIIAGIIICLIVIVCGGGLLINRVLKKSVERTFLGSFIPGLTHGRLTLVKSSVQVPPPTAQPPATAKSKPVVDPASVRAPSAGPWLSPAAAAAPAFADDGEDEEENAALSRGNEQGEPDVAVFNNAGSDQSSARLKPVVWPRLKLSAVFSNVGLGQSGARLNNRLILLGDQIDGVILLKINRDSVVLKYGNETRLLKMGMTLN